MAEKPAPVGTPLVCPFRERDQVQRLGAKWDFRSKAWYVPYAVALEGFDAWLAPEVDDEAKLAHASAHAASKEAASGAMDVDEDEDEVGAADALDAAAVPKMKVADLKSALEARGLEVDGKKGDLVGRLQAALAAPAPSGGGRKVDRSVPDRQVYTVYRGPRAFAPRLPTLSAAAVRLGAYAPAFLPHPSPCRSP